MYSMLDFLCFLYYTNEQGRTCILYYAVFSLKKKFDKILDLHNLGWQKKKLFRFIILNTFKPVFHPQNSNAQYVVTRSSFEK